MRIYESLRFDVHISLSFVIFSFSPLHALKNISIFSVTTVSRIPDSREYFLNSTLFKFVEHPYNFLVNYIGVRLFNRQKSIENSN